MLTSVFPKNVFKRAEINQYLVWTRYCAKHILSVHLFKRLQHKVSHKKQMNYT